MCFYSGASDAIQFDERKQIGIHGTHIKCSCPFERFINSAKCFGGTSSRMCNSKKSPAWPSTSARWCICSLRWSKPSCAHKYILQLKGQKAQCMERRHAVAHVLIPPPPLIPLLHGRIACACRKRVGRMASCQLLPVPLMNSRRLTDRRFAGRTWRPIGCAPHAGCRAVADLRWGGLDLWI